MNELLEVKRRELELVRYYFDESGSYTEIVPEAATAMYDRLLQLHAWIRSSQDNAKLCFVEIGQYLAEIERDKLYCCVACGPGRRDGYSNFYKFCEGIFGFKKTTVVNLLKVYRTFCNQTDGRLSVDCRWWASIAIVYLRHVLRGTSGVCGNFTRRIRRRRGRRSKMIWRSMGVAMRRSLPRRMRARISYAFSPRRSHPLLRLPKRLPKETRTCGKLRRKAPLLLFTRRT